MHVAVVHNRNHAGVIRRFGRPCPEKYSLRHVQMVADALRQLGHTVSVLQADVTLFDELRRCFPATEADGLAGHPTLGKRDEVAPSGMVFNMAYGIQGDARYTHLPAMLELAGLPYTGSSPLGHALALDKVITKILILDAGVPTPRYAVLPGAGVTKDAAGRPPSPPEFCGLDSDRPAELTRLRFPLVVKPRHESTSYGLRFVRTSDELGKAVEAIVRDYHQQALIEEYIDGREVCIGLLGNDPVEFLPPIELDFGDRPLKLMTWEDKYHKRMDEPRKVCPADLAADTIEHLNHLALATLHACHLRDYARVDFRIDAEGRPSVLEINSMASLGPGGSYVAAAKVAGYDFDSLVKRILEVAHRRYFGESSLPVANVASE